MPMKKLGCLIMCIFILLLYACGPSGTETSPSYTDIQWNEIENNITKHIDRNTDSSYYYLNKGMQLNSTHPLSQSQKFFLYHHLGQHYTNTYQVDSAKKYVLKGMEVAKNEKQKKEYYKFVLQLAYAYNLEENTDSAIQYYKKAIDYYRKKNDTLNLALSLSSEASALMEKGLNEEALERLYEAEEYLTKTDMYLNLGATYENIASIIFELGHDSLNTTYYQKAIKAYKKEKDPTHLAGTYGNLGLYYKNRQLYDSALYYYEKAGKIAHRLNDQLTLARNHLNTGNIFDLLEKPEMARQEYEYSLEICKRENIPYGQYLNHINLGELYLKTGNKAQSLFHLEKAVQFHEQYEFDQFENVLFQLHTVEKDRGNPAKSLDYLERYCYYRDSMINQTKHKELMELRTRYETQKKEAEILGLKQEKQADKVTKAYLIIALASLAIIAMIVIFWSYRKRARTKQRTLKLEKDNQRKRDQMEKLRLEKQLQQEKAERYQLDLELKEQELVYQTLKQAGITHIYKSIKEKLSPFAHRLARKKDQEEFTKTLQDITHDVDQEPLSDFEEMFIQMHGEFYEKLLAINKDLSRSELQLCALLRMNLPSKEIANLLNLSTSTIDQRRHSIRKKLCLENHQNLISFLISL
ncbi:MAG: hypothetical protein K9I94_15595 [Bacteroidales bacterium]|nr:hypothetical protein [Bacteroidales bacterium]